MLPPLKTIERGLRGTTEALARELAHPGAALPPWNELEWQLASAAATVHGVAALLSKRSAWQQPTWQAFLASQHAHVEQRHRRIEALLQQIDLGARAAGIAIVPLKGSALHAIGLYAAGERPMADIDLLVRGHDVQAASELLVALGYEESYTQWKHRVFKPAGDSAVAGLGEHRDTPVNIELHTRIQERLPISVVDITERIYSSRQQPGLNAYPSPGALMCHLLLHAAGNFCSRTVRLLHLHDIAQLAARMHESDWDVLWQADTPPWWALPPLRMVQRYYPQAIPSAVLMRIARSCQPLLRGLSRHQDLTRVSCSALWLNALPGIEWSRSAGEAVRCVINRFRPTAEAVKERADMLRTQVWLQGQQHWVTMSQGKRILIRLTRPVPRPDTLYAVRAALTHFAT
ncbi:nucleotidyltransferase family protein [Dyella acidiphila]|uniref:Nucleotidyltransferase family protein n=1 Tax=Dyella acidiphila TaxID=2775866 RepID=A0ABR9GD20_9GAMM|nr:nucleotidyltransferase family protein [Dyella acidiphila]MBE1161889.1 nucleotidyltransferase family protein [Dyella acidiphila]